MAKKRANKDEYLRVARQILETKPSDMYNIRDRNKNRNVGPPDKKESLHNSFMECSEQNK